MWNREYQGGRPPRKAWLPVRIDEQRGVWRYAQELLLSTGARRGDGPPRRRPRALNQIAELAYEGHLPSDAVYTLRVFGQRLDDKGGAIQY